MSANVIRDNERHSAKEHTYEESRAEALQVGGERPCEDVEQDPNPDKKRNHRLHAPPDLGSLVRISCEERAATRPIGNHVNEHGSGARHDADDECGAGFCWGVGPNEPEAKDWT